jgi:hypothetical protein
MLALEKQSEIIQLRGLGNSYDKIAEQLNISKPTAIKVCLAYEDKVANLHAKQIETTLEEAAYNLEVRSSMYKQLIQRLYKEISTRDLSEISTDRLFSMLEKTERSLTAIETRNTSQTATNALIENMSDENLALIAGASQTASLPETN